MFDFLCTVFRTPKLYSERWSGTFTLLLYACLATGQDTQIQYLSGTDKDHTVMWDFMINTGMKSGSWAKIPVPSCWEQKGFGTFNYFDDKVNPEEMGIYRHTFTINATWQNKTIYLVFDGAMTDTEVKIDGRSAGPVHQGGFYQFRYDITNLVQPGTAHQLEVIVRKMSGNRSINRAERQSDYWLFGGLFRPVFLEALPVRHIERIAIDARADGKFGVQVITNAPADHTVEVQIQELNGKVIGSSFEAAAGDSIFLSQQLNNVLTWNPEKPHLYNAIVTLQRSGEPVHRITQRFGFRTVQFRPRDGFYINNTKIVFKGVNRHSHWPESGRTLSRQIHLLDIGLLKQMNMNAVRMSHYPPDREFLDLCDSLGLFVIDELTGWQKAYDTVTARRLVKEMLVRDVNHPSIVMWANGNEGGFNRGVDGDYQWYDPQHRLVIHPWERFNGTDTKHYPDFNYITNSVLYGDEPFFPTEFMHGLFDGGHGAGLSDFWTEMSKHRAFSGGFLWSFHDEGAVRTDKGGEIDVAGNSAPDGIVGPHREKEGSYYAIKEIWSPVVVHNKVIGADFNGEIRVENKYHFTNFSECKMHWKLLRFSNQSSIQAAQAMHSGTATAYELAPGEKGVMTLKLPNLKDVDALLLTATGPAGDTVCSWSWPISQPVMLTARVVEVAKKGKVKTNLNGERLQVRCDAIDYFFNQNTGYLSAVKSGKKSIDLMDGPALSGRKGELKSFKYELHGEELIINATYTDSLSWLNVAWSFVSGRLPILTYSFSQKGASDFAGIAFNYPEAQITGMTWLGRGPYRVWKNRMEGQQFGVWSKPYNNTITGESWSYPEFKGWHSDVYWVQVQSKEKDFKIYSDRSDTFLQMLQPAKPKGAKNENTSPAFPETSLGFMHAISPIGTKFQPPHVMGPQGQKNVQLNYTPYTGKLYFDFR